MTRLSKFSTSGQNSKFFRALNLMIDAINECQGMTVPGSLKSQTTSGTSFKTLAKPAGSSASNTFKGEYVLDSDYSAGESVIVRGATNAGYYICVNDTDDRPWDSTNWVQLSDNNTIGMFS